MRAIRAPAGSSYDGAGAERRRVRALLERAGVAMLMNVDEKGTHMGRPMLPLLVSNDPHIYFLTHHSSRKVTRLAVRPQVGLSIISTNCVVVVAGSAQLSRDHALIRRLWSQRIAHGFPRVPTIVKPCRNRRDQFGRVDRLAKWI